MKTQIQYDYLDRTCFGIRSDTIDGYHIPMLDIDSEYSLDQIKRVLSDIQNTFLLSDFFILKSTKGYNAFTLDKLSLEEVHNILSGYDEIDQLYNCLGVSSWRGFYVLRIGNDKVFFDRLASTNNVYEKSLAHWLFFNNIVGLPMPNLLAGKIDKNTKYKIVKYRSKKHGFKK